MNPLRKHISSRNPHQFIILRTQHLQISRQCRTVTAHIHFFMGSDPGVFHSGNKSKIPLEIICSFVPLASLPQYAHFIFSSPAKHYQAFIFLSQVNTSSSEYCFLYFLLLAHHLEYSEFRLEYKQFDYGLLSLVYLLHMHLRYSSIGLCSQQ